MHILKKISLTVLITFGFCAQAIIPTITIDTALVRPNLELMFKAAPLIAGFADGMTAAHTARSLPSKAEAFKKAVAHMVVTAVATLGYDAARLFITTLWNAKSDDTLHTIKNAYVNKLKDESVSSMAGAVCLYLLGRIAYRYGGYKKALS